jgi:single-stranded-DNA-specific exonuclease
LEHANIAVELFITGDGKKAAELAQKAAELNDERKSITKQAADAALAALSETESGDKVLVLYAPNVPESVAGIVAGRIKEATCHPVVILTDSGDLLKGSARSIEGFHMFDALCKCKTLFTRFGGHAMAAGLSMSKENLPALRKSLNENCNLTEKDFISSFTVDKEIPLSAASVALARDLAKLEPFGNGNPEPLFLSKNALCESVDFLGANKQTLRLNLLNRSGGGAKTTAMIFGGRDGFDKALRDAKGEKFAAAFYARTDVNDNAKPAVDIVYAVSLHTYNGRESAQIRVVDYKFKG